MMNVGCARQSYSDVLVASTPSLPMKLFVKTLPAYFVEEDKILAALFDAGLDGLLVCKPGQEPLYAERLLSLLPEACRGDIYVAQHFYLKGEYGLGGIVLDGDATPAGYKGDVVRVCRDLGALKAVKKQSALTVVPGVVGVADFGGTEPWAESDLATAARHIDRKVLAAGGVTPDTLPAIRDLGFGGVVVGEDLWRHFNIHSQSDFRGLAEYFGELRRAAE